MNCRSFWLAIACLAAFFLPRVVFGAQPAAAPEVPGLGSVQQIPELQEAASRFKSGDAEGALTILREAAKKYPDLPPAHAVLAQFYAATNQGAQARAALEQAIAENPDDAEPWTILGQLALQERRMAEAGLLFAKGLELVEAGKKPSKRDANLKRVARAGLAMAAESRKDWPAAQKQYEAMLADDPTNAGALQQLGRALFHQKKYDEARKRFEQAAQANDSLLDPDAQLARLYHEAGDEAAASQHMLAAINANPKDFKTRLLAAQWSLDIGKLDQAEAQAEAAVKLNPQSLDAKFLRGVIALFRKDYKAAQEAFEEVHLLSPGNFAATNHLALALVEQDDPTKRKQQMALEYAQINLRLGPDQPQANSTLGWVYYKLGRLDEAEAALRKASTAGPVTPDTAYYYARVLYDRGRKEEAQRAIEQALKSPAPFPLRQEAEALAAELKK